MPASVPPPPHRSVYLPDRLERCCDVGKGKPRKRAKRVRRFNIRWRLGGQLGLLRDEARVHMARRDVGIGEQAAQVIYVGGEAEQSETRERAVQIGRASCRERVCQYV